MRKRKAEKMHDSIGFINATAALSTSSQSRGGTCSRRALIRAAALATVAATIPNVAYGKDFFGIGEAIPSEEFERVKASVSGDVPLSEFVAQLQSGGVKRVWFFGVQNDYCCFEGADGKLRRIGEGYPTENPRSNESPLQIMAKVRDR